MNDYTYEEFADLQALDYEEKWREQKIEDAIIEDERITLDSIIADVEVNEATSPIFVVALVNTKRGIAIDADIDRDGLREFSRNSGISEVVVTALCHKHLHEPMNNLYQELFRRLQIYRQNKKGEKK